MAIVYVGIDLAKNVFAVHGVDEHGKPALVWPKVARDQLHERVAALPPCTIGMEACSGAHHWARLLGVFKQTTPKSHRIRSIYCKITSCVVFGLFLALRI